MPDYYELLGLPRTASAADVRSAYARLARARHPDRFSDPAEKARAEEDFKELTAAFNTLSNDRARREYDAELERPAALAPAEQAARAYTLAASSLESGKHSAAIELLRVAAAQAPEEPRYHAALARALAASRDRDRSRDAVTAWEHAIALAPGNAAFQAELARLLHELGLTIRAVKIAEAALRLDPADPLVQRVAAEVGAGGAAGGGLRGLLKKKP
jgi:curved DNA-binding protein CbpA